MTSQEIQRISANKLAIQNKLYYSDSGITYIGTKEGRLKLVEKAKNLPFRKTPDITSKNVQKAIEEVSDTVEYDTVRSLNDLKGRITLKEGSNVVITKIGNDLQITFLKPADIVFDDSELIKEDKTLQEQIDDISNKFRILLFELVEQGIKLESKELLNELEQKIEWK